MLALLPTTLAFLLPAAPVSQPRACARSAAPQMVDMETILGVGIALGGAVGGVGLIVFTENAGKRNEAEANQQPCVVCKGAKVVTCTICKGTGRDPLASYVAGVREMAGEEGSSASVSTVTVEDWADGPKTVEIYGEILADYPPKVTEDVCIACDGRGVVVCDNCEGTGIQPRFLERYSPDDFMD